MRELVIRLFLLFKYVSLISNCVGGGGFSAVQTYCGAAVAVAGGGGGAALQGAGGNGSTVVKVCNTNTNNSPSPGADGASLCARGEDPTPAGFNG